MPKRCPCNPKVLYADCCQKAHQNIHSVTTAEALMRSRYSAFVLANIDYLQISQHTTTRPKPETKKDTLRRTKSVRWVRLEVLETSDGLAHEATGVVEFKAFYIEKNKLQRIHEVSTFCKENGHWVYLGKK